ncbi:MAG: tRNA lysidine(34) synthetase TilS [Acidobacteriia bacterium]|nr:tRNA lysidine(34) synthetase TilS [Terriglobia bacterium]
MFERVAEIITRYNMFRHGARIGAAVSGGADSVCLLHVLLALAPRWDLRLSVLHLNHQLRGEESERDQEFVVEMAARLGLPAMVERWGGEEGNLEEAAREARLEFFTRTIASGAVERVALGHTRSDQAETVLFRFLRGAGTAGLAGIRPVTAAGIVRPLLAVGRGDVEAFLRERGIAWREDSTNASPVFARNRIRHSLLPQLAREWNPAIAETLAHTADWALGEESYWEGEMDRLSARYLTESRGAVLAPVEAFRALPAAASRRLVRRAMERVKGDLRAVDFRHILAVLDMVSAGEGHGRMQAPGLDIFRSFDWVRFARPGLETLENRNFRLPAPVPGSVEIPGSGRGITLQVIEKANRTKPTGSVYNGPMGLDWGRVSGGLELRNWRPGDQYQPAGSSAEEKVKQLFQKARVPLWERRHWPVLTDGANILWVRQFGPAARYAADADTEAVLVVSETAAPAPKEESGSCGSASIQV